jgi:hypothetical protein
MVHRVVSLLCNNASPIEATLTPTRRQPGKLIGSPAQYLLPIVRYAKTTRKRACAAVTACCVWIRSNQQGAAFPCPNQTGSSASKPSFSEPGYPGRPSTARSLRGHSRPRSVSVSTALAGASPTLTTGSPIRYRGVRKASSMRSVEAVADFEKVGVRSLTASSGQLEVLLLSPCWRERRAWPACGDGTGAPPSRQCQAALAVALRASIDRMSAPRWWLIKQTRVYWRRYRALISEWDWSLRVSPPVSSPPLIGSIA